MMRAVRVNRNTEDAGRETKTMSLKRLKHAKELQKIAELGDNSRPVCHYKQPLSHYTLIWSIIDIKINDQRSFKFKFICKIVSHPDGQHDVGVALQDLDCIAVGDVIKADPVGCKDLIAHFDAMLFCKPTRVQPEEKIYKKVYA